MNIKEKLSIIEEECRVWKFKKNHWEQENLKWNEIIDELKIDSLRKENAAK